MIIPEAIEILGELPENLNNVLDYDQQDALKLGMEALKREQQRRNLELTGIKVLLPGETNE